MNSSASIIYPFKSFRSMARKRKVWLRANHIDYVSGKMSKRTYKFSNLIVNLASIFYYDLLVFIFLLILGPIFFF